MPSSMLIKFSKESTMNLFSILKRSKLPGHGISIIIPFRRSRKYPRQAENFAWVKAYWRCQLPGAEIIVGKDRKCWSPFSKSAAVNAGARKAKGDILVIADADGYIPVQAVTFCAAEIRRAREKGQRLWYIPYRQFYRLTETASLRVLRSDPCAPYKFPNPPHPDDEDSTGTHPGRHNHHRHRKHHHHHWSGSKRGHWYGAMCQIMPREAFDEVGGWDERFRGWGGEDHSAMRAMDTLYWRHKTIAGQVLHLWHPMMGKDGTKDWVDWKDRLWDKQKTAGSNGRLAARYSVAFGDRKRMRALVNEGRKT